MVNKGKIDEIINNYHPNWIINIGNSKSQIREDIINQKTEQSIKIGDIRIYLMK